MDSNIVSANKEDIPVETMTARKAKRNKKKRKEMNNGVAVKKLKVHQGQPTAEEIFNLKEAESHASAGLFRLQITELLNNCKLVKSNKRPIKVWVDQLSRSLKSLEKIGPRPLTNWSWIKDELNVEFPLAFLELAGVKGNFHFVPPDSCRVIGSFDTHAVAPNFGVDIVITLPKEFYNHTEDPKWKGSVDDSENMTYFIKRAMYLCVIANHLSNSQLLKRPPEFSFAHGEILKPSLYLIPNIDSSMGIGIHLIPSPEAEVFSLSKLTPDMCNLLSNKDMPTPLYNSILAADICQQANEKLRISFFKEFPAFKEAMILLKVWLAQRLSDQTVGGFSSYILSMFVMYLHQKGKLNKFMTAYEVMRTVWYELSQANWCAAGITLNEKPSNAPSLSDFHKYFEVVFIDPSGFCNLTARMNHVTFLKVKREAGNALSLVDDPENAGFKLLFLTQIKFLLQYDHIVSFDSRMPILKGAGDMTADDFNWPFDKFFRNIIKEFERCLGFRCLALAYQHHLPNWPVSSKSPVLSTFTGTLLIGLRLCPINALSAITMGPSAEVPEAIEFQKMWCNNTETRRFQDGRIAECMVWEDSKSSFGKRMLITKKIIDFILKYKFNIVSNNYVYIADQLDFILDIPVLPQTSIEEVSTEVNQLINELIQKLINLDDTYLKIISVYPTSSIVCQTDVFPPLNLRKYRTLHFSDVASGAKDYYPEYLPAINMVIQLESSSKWPNHLQACENLLSLFYQSLSESLQKNCNLKSYPLDDSLSIFWGGFFFVLEVGSSKLIALKKERIVDGILFYEDNKSTFELEKSLIYLPQITSALRALDLAHPGFHNTARMAKRWLCTEMIDEELFPPIVVDHLVAYLFLNSQPYTTPFQPLIGFLRFLNLMCNTIWESQPIIVNFNATFTGKDMAEINDYFEQNRKSLPSVFISTPFDKLNSVWTKYHPSTAPLVRVAGLAKVTLSKLEIGLTTGLNKVPYIKPRMEFYHILITLNKKKVPRSNQRLTKVAERKIRRTKFPKLHKPSLGNDPVAWLLTNLRMAYSGYAHFFYDTYGGLKIGVRFSSAAFKAVDYKIADVPACESSVVDGKTKYTFNFMLAIDHIKACCKSLLSYMLVAPMIISEMEGNEALVKPISV